MTVLFSASSRSFFLHDRERTSTTSSTPLNFKVVGQRSRSRKFFLCCGYPRTLNTSTSLLNFKVIGSLLRSANSRTCVVRRTYSSYADRCFAAARPKLWNSLPAHLRQTDINFQQFKRLLMRHFCSCVEIVVHCGYCPIYTTKFFRRNGLTSRLDRVNTYQAMGPIHRKS